MITAGVDCGAKNTKTVILRDGEIVGKAAVLTGVAQHEAILAAYERALKHAGVAAGEVNRACGTGSGKGVISDVAERVNDIQAMAMGAHYFFPNARTVVDVGAEEGRAVRIDERGHVVDFAVNEKCAAGAGAFIEAMAGALEISLKDIGPLALQSEKHIPMNAQCVIFAESEVVGLIHARTEKSDISKAIHDAMAGSITAMIRRVGVNEDVVMMGGVGRNPGLTEAVRRELGMECLYIPEGPEYGAAVGAAVMAAQGRASG